MTTDGEAARAWLTGHLDAGIEGVVAKRLDPGYLRHGAPGEKVETRTSAEAVVGGVSGPFNTPVALVLGRRDNARRQPAAPCCAPRRAPPLPPRTTPGEIQRRRPRRVHASRTNSRRGTRCRRSSRHGGSRPVWRHPATFRRIRADLRPSDI